MIECHPVSAKDLSRRHQFGKTVLPGFFLGYVLHAGRNLERRHGGVGKDGRIRKPREKTQCKGSDNAPKWWIFHIPDCRWKSETIWRRSGSENVHLDTGQSWTRRRTWRSSRRIRWVSTTRLIAVWRWSTKRFLVNFRKLHLPSTRWTKSQTLRTERGVIPNSTPIDWRGQHYKYDLGRNIWTPQWRQLECRRGPRSIRCVDGFHTVHLIGWETSRRVFMVRGRLTKKQTTSRPDHLWPEIWKNMSDAAQRKEQKWTIEKPKLDNAEKLRGTCFIYPTDAQFKETITKRAEKVGSYDASSRALQDQEKQARGNL